MTLTSSCGAAQESATEAAIFEQMQENKIQYVGNNSGVSRLLSFLPNFDKNYTQNMFSLQTQNKPYGIVIYYEPSEQWNGSDMAVTDEMTTYSEYLFECIDDLGYIEFSYRPSSSNGNLEKSEYQMLLHIDRK